MPLEPQITAPPSSFVRYRVTIQFRDRVLGGIPLQFDAIAAWIKRAGISAEEEHRALLLRTIREIGADVPAEPTLDALEAAAGKLAVERNTDGFKRGHAGPYLETRIFKSMLKEVTNQIFAREDVRWGRHGRYPGKSPRALVAEEVFVVSPDAAWARSNLGTEDALPFYAEPADTDPLGEIDGVEQYIGHPTLPTGQKVSTLGYYQYMQGRTMVLDLRVAEDRIPHEAWVRIWDKAEENAIGAKRSQGFGKFQLLRMEQVADCLPRAGGERFSFALRAS